MNTRSGTIPLLPIASRRQVEPGGGVDQQPQHEEMLRNSAGGQQAHGAKMPTLMLPYIQAQQAPATGAVQAAFDDVGTEAI